ncbi:MAG: transferase [Bacteroidetes bacterium B1(2017)]|nr:MAG: transferase [Bacteroidetes bacterium B1(2017)]
MSVIFGSAGFAKEVDWFLHEICAASDSKELLASSFIGKDNVGESINGKSVLSEEDFFGSLKATELVQAFLAVGSPRLRKKIYEKIKEYSQISFPSIIYPTVNFDTREGKVLVGEGSIICAGSVLTTDIKIGSQVHVNLNCTIGHDTTIGDFCTLSPGVHVSGNVAMGNGVFVGTGAVILERLSICDDAVIGAGSVVTKSILEPGVYVGIPAKKLNK